MVCTRIARVSVLILSGMLPSLMPSSNTPYVSKQHRSDPMAQSAFGVTWQPIGPAPIGTPDSSRPLTGHVSAIAVHPTDANIIYLGADTGGVWKTTDGGTTWTPLTDQQCSSN